MSSYYTLDDAGEPVGVHDPLAWARWMEENNSRRVAFDVVDGKEVSTVFLGLDHNFGPHGLPLLFETMVFNVGSYRDLDCKRYATRAEALAGHAQTCDDVRAGTIGDDAATEAAQ